MEIVAAPKVYAFDTGFVCYVKGWRTLRDGDRGVLFEHLVLNEMVAKLSSHKVRYWRDKRGHELDFVIADRGRSPVAIECKWSGAQFDAANLLSFRGRYPEGKNFVVCQDAGRGYTRKFGGLSVRFTDLPGLITALSG